MKSTSSYYQLKEKLLVKKDENIVVSKPKSVVKNDNVNKKLSSEFLNSVFVAILNAESTKPN